MSTGLPENKDDLKKTDSKFPLCEKVDPSGEDNFPQKIYEIVGELAAFFYEIDNKSEESKS